MTPNDVPNANYFTHLAHVQTKCPCAVQPWYHLQQCANIYRACSCDHLQNIHPYTCICMIQRYCYNEHVHCSFWYNRGNTRQYLWRKTNCSVASLPSIRMQYIYRIKIKYLIQLHVIRLIITWTAAFEIPITLPAGFLIFFGCFCEDGEGGRQLTLHPAKPSSLLPKTSFKSCWLL